jgi:N-acyl-L-homoserine lactone synthetase
MFGSRKTDEEKAAARRQRQIAAAAASAGLTVMNGKFRAPNQEPVAVEGSRITIERGEDAGKRVTATRVLLTGIFALALKKDMTQLFITIENGEQVMMCPVPAKKEAAARVFATMVNGEATGLTTT